jgi:hypothetical protein
MQAVIVHPASAADGLRAREAVSIVPEERLPDVILPSQTLRPEERLAIYHGMYPLRMREALAGDYPGLEHFLGDPGFADFVRDYVRAHPSRSYTLNRLGDHVPEFIARRRGLEHRAFLLDLARLERAVNEAFDADETPRLTEEQVQAVPQEAWATARLVAVASLRLLEVDHPVNEYLESVKREDHDHPRPVKKPGFVAVYRRNYGVYRQDLAKPAFGLLRDLAGGKPLGASLRAAARRGGRPPGEDQLFRWFREWVSAGMFTRVDTAGGPPSQVRGGGSRRSSRAGS